VRTALWAIGVTVLSNVANILKQLRDVIESATQLQAFIQDHVWILAVLLGIAVVWGNALLFRFLYRRLNRRISAAYKVLTATGCLLVVSGVFATNVFSLKSLLQNPVQVQQKLIDQLEGLQGIEGGFKYNALPQSSPAAWETAQSLKAILLAGRYDPDRVKQAFSFIESKRQSEGFENTPNPGGKIILRTEVVSWVTLAYLESLSKPDLWTEMERAKTIALVEKTLRLIVSLQDQASGGWGPIPQAPIDDERTWATTMAVWALTEALLSKDVPDQTKQSLLPAFGAGVSWLISHYVDNLGWEENPKYSVGQPFPGLTYQVLFVLERAQLVSGHNSFKNTEVFLRIKREFKQTIQAAEVMDSTSTPTTYDQVGDCGCSGEFLAYPWLLGVLPTLIADPDVPPADRRYLKGVLTREVDKVTDLPNRLIQAETWKVDESLIGVSNFISSQQKQK
jgi:hypothetical protein